MIFFKDTDDHAQIKAYPMVLLPGRKVPVKRGCHEITSGIFHESSTLGLPIIKKSSAHLVFFFENLSLKVNLWCPLTPAAN
jgi:hypothetical protein